MSGISPRLSGRMKEHNSEVISKGVDNMCGIVGGIGKGNIVPILLEGLKRLEYRGYDSAGVAVIDASHSLRRQRVVGKVKELEHSFRHELPDGTIGIAHTRWATHGAPSTRNAHPHVSHDRVALVHNGIIENHTELRNHLLLRGYEFTSDTDTEVIVHQVYDHLKQGKDLLQAMMDTASELMGAYALGVVSVSEPDLLIATRRGSPLVIGIGTGEYFIASDVSALLSVTQRFIFLEDGD